MPVKKYRSVAEMPGPPELRPLDPDNLRRAFALCELTAWLHPVSHVPGVRKFRSLEEANRHREAWEAEQIHTPDVSRIRLATERRPV